MSEVEITKARYRLKAIGKYLSLNGASDYLSLAQGSLSLYKNNTAYSISVWIKPHVFDTVTSQAIYSEGSAVGNSPVFLFYTLNSSGRNVLGILLRDDSANVLINNVVTFSRPLVPDRDVHVLLTDDNGEVHIYIDGVEDSVSAAGSFDYTRTGNFNFTKSTIGALNRASLSNYFNGKIGRTRLFSTALSADEALQESRFAYNDTTNLIAAYSYNDTVTDITGNGNNGTLTGGSYTTDVPSGTRSATNSRFYVPSSAQKSLETNGSPAYATVPVTPATTGWCLGVWLNSLTLGANLNEKVIAYTNNGNGGFHLYQLKNTGRYFFQLFNVTTNDVNASPGNNTTIPGIFQFLVLTYAPNSFKMYLNNVLVATDTSCQMTAPNVSQVLTLGKASYGLSLFSQVQFKNFTFQNTPTPWTTDQISDLYYKNKIPTGALQWAMNNVATDQNGENALTLNSATYQNNVPPHLQARPVI